MKGVRKYCARYCAEVATSTRMGSWISEFAPELKCSIAYADNREEAFATEADVYITNTTAVWLAKPKVRNSFD